MQVLTCLASISLNRPRIFISMITPLLSPARQTDDQQNVSPCVIYDRQTDKFRTL